MICPDASLAIKWVVDEDHQDQARTLYRDSRRAEEPIIAPFLLRIEVTNILRQRVRRFLLSADEAVGLLDQVLAFSIDYHNPGGLNRQALMLANAYGLPAAYDAHDLALAQAFDCDFWTGDRRLVNTVAGRLPFVRWIGDYEA